jgi:hypothetical protein
LSTKNFLVSGYIDWTQCSEEAKRMKKSGSHVHEAFLLRERERKRQANQGWKSQRIKIHQLDYRFSIDF